MTGETPRAVALMRERARAARAGRWIVNGAYVLAEWAHDMRLVAECTGALKQGNESSALHIASWDPAVALAAADLTECPCEAHAETFARTYLGQQP